MNKRIRKKNDGDRIFYRYLAVTTILAERIADIYARLEGYEEANDIFWQNCEEEFDKWRKLPRGRGCRTYIWKKYNIPKYIGYKNKVMRG